MANIPQTLNNCGPASIAEVLAYWGIYRTQSEVQAVLRVDGPKEGMIPYGVPSYARSLGMDALIGFAGTPAVLKALIRHGFPVIVTQWVSMTDHTSHYRPITAFDDRQGIFLANDPYLGANHVLTYADFAPMWASDDRTFLVLYPSSRRAEVDAIVAAAGWNKARAYRQNLAWLRARLSGSVQQDPSWTASLVPGEGYLRLAWDEAQLGQTAAARLSLQRARAQGATPTAVGWIAGTSTLA